MNNLDVSGAEYRVYFDGERLGKIVWQCTYLPDIYFFVWEFSCYHVALVSSFYYFTLINYGVFYLPPDDIS